MAHSRQDVERIRESYFKASDASITATRELINVLTCQLRAEENARRAVTMVMGEGPDEEPLVLTPNIAVQGAPGGATK